MTIVHAVILALLAITSGANVAAAMSRRKKSTLAAVIGTAIGLFIGYCAAIFFQQHSFTYLPVFALIAGAIMFAGSLAGSGLVSLKRRMSRD